MIFSDLRFIAVFAVCWFAFVSVRPQHRAAVLAATGIVFYAVFAGWFLAVVLAMAAAAWLASRRWQLTAAALLIVAVLAFVKLRALSPPASPGAAVLVPLGLSYLSFELLHVVIERRRGRLGLFGVSDLLAFIFFMPCRIAGPIRRLPTFRESVNTARPSMRDVHDGVVRILIGFAKKLIVADTLALTIAEIDAVQTAQHAWIVVVAYSFFILFDFSAYSDLAIGFARLLGIRVPENFNYPYLAVNIRDFWNRWHITLSHWVRDYVFVPTSRQLFATRLRPYPAAIAIAAYLLTFLVVGAWHGLTPAFLVWGAYHGALLGAHHVLQARMPLVVTASTWYQSWIGTASGCAITFFFVTIGWLPFMTDLDRAAALARLMFGAGR